MPTYLTDDLDVRQFAALAARILPAPVVSAMSTWPDATWTNVPGSNTVKRIPILADCASIRLVYINAYSYDDTAPPDDICYRAAIKKTVAATSIAVRFRGSRDGICSPNGVLISDEIMGPWKAGDYVYVNTYAAGPTIVYSLTQKCVSAWSEGSDAGFNVARADNTLGTISPNNNAGVAPFCIIGPGAKAPDVRITGDSIAAGLYDTTWDVAGYGAGFIARGLAGTVPFINVAFSGDGVGRVHNALRYQLLLGGTDIIHGMGANDVSQVPATFKALYLYEWAKLGAGGARVWQTTLVPQTTSSDNWATTGNQTPKAYESNRLDFNAWLRDGAPISAGVAVAVGSAGIRAGQAGHPLAGVFDSASKVEVDAAGNPSLTGGRWSVGNIYTGDGTGLHPSPAGAALMGTAIDPSRFKDY